MVEGEHASLVGRRDIGERHRSAGNRRARGHEQRRQQRGLRLADDYLDVAVERGEGRSAGRQICRRGRRIIDCDGRAGGAVSKVERRSDAAAGIAQLSACHGRPRNRCCGQLGGRGCGCGVGGALHRAFRVIPGSHF